jgi:hypothetical protein
MLNSIRDEPSRPSTNRTEHRVHDQEGSNATRAVHRLIEAEGWTPLEVISRQKNCQDATDGTNGERGRGDCRCQRITSPFRDHETRQPQ